MWINESAKWINVNSSLDFLFNSDLHFKPQQAYPSKTSISECECEPGYYCTQDDDCSTCMEHTVCKPGQRLAKKGLCCLM